MAYLICGVRASFFFPVFLAIKFIVQPGPTKCHPAICHMRQVTFAVSVHLILLITCPVIHAVEQRLTRRYDLIVADDWRFGNAIERVEEEMMTQNSVSGANEVASISLERLRHTSSIPAILGVCSATLAPQTTRSFCIAVFG
jgi:hypothetical protein